MSPSIHPALEQRLFAADPLDPEGILRTDTSLGLDALAEARTLVNARTLLAALVEQPTKATAKLKNLNRAFVKRMTEEMAWPPGYVEQVWRYNRVLDETDVPRLFILRHLGLLLRTYLGRLNWAFVDVGPEDRAMLSYCVHAPWTIRELTENGATADEIASRLAVSDTIWLEGRPWPGGPDNLPRAVQRRLLEPLWDFGFLTEDADEDNGPPRWDGSTITLHAFEIEGRRYGIPDDSFGFDTTLPEEEIVLGDLAGVGVDRFVYEYDFGDGWEHQIVVESLGEPASGVTYPRCIAGERACPPEDCGGIPGFAEFLETMADPQHPEHEAMRVWYGGEFDPDAFSTEQTRVLLRMVWTGEIPDD